MDIQGVIFIILILALLIFMLSIAWQRNNKLRRIKNKRLNKEFEISKQYKELLEKRKNEKEIKESTKKDQEN